MMIEAAMNYRSEMIAKISNTPPLSHSAMKLLDIIAEDNHSINDIIKIVESDSVLTASILRLVNSASFGLLSEIDSISRAVAFVGDKVVVGMAIASCSGGIYNHPLDGYGSETRAALWKHSLKTAIASREIANHAFKRLSPVVAFTAGILHDIGKAVISEYIGKAKPAILDIIAGQEVVDFLIAEKETMGTTHCEMGFELARHWKLPDIYRDVIHYHHNPTLTDNRFRDMTFVVHLADMIAMMSGTGTGIDTLQYQLDKDFYQYISINSEEIERIMLDAEEDFRKTSQALFLD